jgi:hypothetical protein
MGSFEFRALIDSTVNPLWVYLVKICQSEIPSMPSKRLYYSTSWPCAGLE